jgi:rubrerythrin
MSDIEKERAARLARMLRERLDVDHLVQMDMIRVLDELKRLRLIVDYLEVPASDLGGAEGRFDPHTGIMSFPHGTLTGARRGSGRSNFTIAHEIGHWADKVEEVRNRGSPRGARTARDETFADSFAAEFLAPYDKANFSADTTPVELRGRFNLSADAARFRHKEFSERFRRENNIERALPADVVDFLEEARARGRPVRNLPRRPQAPTVQRPIPPSPASPAVEENCNVCGSPRIELDGSTRARCPECRATYERFQDGDSAAGSGQSI